MKKQRLFKSVLVLLLCMALVLPCLPINAFAAKLDNFDTGSDFSGVKMSVIGDSISTYYGITNSSTYNPLYLSTSQATFGTYYGNTSHGDYAQFSSVKWEDTWWKQTVDTLGMDLLVNNAWSGSFTLVDTGQSNTTEYPAAGYKNRAVNLHKGTTKPDIICVYLGTNDVAYYASQNVGTKADIDTASERNALYTSVNSYKTPTSAIQAYYIMISRMLATYPDAEIYCILPTISLNAMAAGRTTALNNFNAGVSYIVDYYAGNGKDIFLVDLPTNSGLVDETVVKNYYYCNNVHPSCEGMDFITSCVVSEILEHSQKGKQTSTTANVSYSFDRTFSATGLPRKTIVGKPFELEILPYSNAQDVELTVTMKDAKGNAVTIPGGGVSGETVVIPNVTGDITITAKATDHPDSFYWKAVADDFAAIPGNGYTYNQTTKLSGTYTKSGDTAKMATVQYSLEKPVVLKYDQPWTLEWRSGGNTYAGGIMLFNKETASSTDGNMYIHITQSDVFFGYRANSMYYNSGVAWTTIASKLGSSAGSDIRKEMMDFKIVNVPNGTSNKLWLYVNGVQIGTMDSSKKIGSSATDSNVSNINISGKDFEFNYLGSSNHTWNNCNISYIRLHETGSLNTETTFPNYRWEPSNNKLVSVENDTFAANVASQITGSISGTAFTSATFELDHDVVLLHDKYWSIEWASSGNWSGDRNGSFLMTTVLPYKANSAHYIFRQGGSSLIGFGEWTNGIHNNYGLSLADYGIDGTAYHKYTLKNEPVFKNGAWTSNMVYLYVDDVKLGAMNQYFPSGEPDGTTSDWLNGRDLVFGAIGNDSFTLGGVNLEYLQVNTGCAHVFGSWSVTTAASCVAAGVETRTCSQCGETQTRALAATGHSYQSTVTAPSCTTGGYTTYKCSVCGDTYQGNTTAATGHSYQSTVTAPSCTTGGYTTHKCSVCGDTYQSNTTPATGHSYKATVITPTCTTTGYTTYSCDQCGYSYVADEIGALGHMYTSVVTAPTCTSGGYTTYTCSECSNTYVADHVSATGHHYNPVVTAPTCTEGGYTTFTCNGCDHSYKDLLTNPTGHNYDAVITAPTCTEAGYTTYTCTCGDTYAGNQTNATGHSFVNGICGACGTVDPNYSPAVVIPTLTLKAPTLEFKDMITVNAMFTAENIEDVAEMGMITYTEKVDEWSVETAAHVIPGTTYDVNTGRYIAASQGIHAKYLGDTVYLACYAKLTDGSYVYTKLAGYSPVQYATSKLNGTDVPLKQLVVAMLNYGAAAQTHFEHNVENLANATLTAEQIALPEAYRSDMVSTVASPSTEKQGLFANNKGFAKRYPSISFEGAFCINYFFTPNYAPVDGITLYYWNAADYEAATVLSIENASGSFKLDGEGIAEYRGDITGIAAKDLSGAVYVAAVYSDGTTEWTSGVLGYSIGAYCSSQATKGGTIADLAMATAVYGYQAKVYFG